MSIDSNSSLFISLLMQFFAIFIINLFLLNYKITKQDIIPVFLLIFLPTLFLFLAFGPFAAFYILISLIIFFKRKHQNHVFILHILVSFILSVIIDHLASILSIHLFSNTLPGYLFFILRDLLFCLLIAAAAYLYKRVFHYLIHKNQFSQKILYLFIFVVFLTLLFFYLNIAMMPSFRSYEAIQFNLWIFSIYLVLILAIAAAIVFLSIKQYKIQAKEKEQQNFSNYLKLLEQTNEDTRSFQHDYINILTSIRHYIEKEDIPALKTYFYDQILPTQQKEIDTTIMLNELNNLQIDGLKGLLTTKFLHAKEHDIPMHLEVREEIDNIRMDIIELNRVLGILLDNAIEASKVIDHPIIQVAFIKLEDSILIVLSNKIQEGNELKVHDVFREGYSTKGKNRGFGLSILKEIINRNNHTVLHTKIENHHFIQELEIKQEGIYA